MSKTKVKMTKDMGRGVFATENINKKIVVEISPCLTWTDRCQPLLQDTILRFYVFEGTNRNNSVLALGVGSLFNHNSKPNLKYKYDAKRNVMTFTAKRKIYKGEQLFVDYGYNPVDQLKRWELQKAVEPHINRYDEAVAAAKLDEAGKVPVSVLPGETLKEEPFEDYTYQGINAQIQQGLADRSGDMIRVMGDPCDMDALCYHEKPTLKSKFIKLIHTEEFWLWFTIALYAALFGSAYLGLLPAWMTKAWY